MQVRTFCRTAKRISPWNSARYPFWGGTLVSNPESCYLPSWIPTWNGRNNFSNLNGPTVSSELILWDIPHTCIRYRIVVLPAESSPSIKIRTSFSFQPASEVRDANNELKLIPILCIIIIVLFFQVRRSGGPRSKVVAKTERAFAFDSNQIARKTPVEVSSLVAYTQCHYNSTKYPFECPQLFTLTFFHATNRMPLRLPPTTQQRRSLVSFLFMVTFVGSVVTVAASASTVLPCPIRPKSHRHALADSDEVPSPSQSDKAATVIVQQRRPRHRWIEERPPTA